MAKTDPDERIQQRLQNISEATDWVLVVQDIADEVDGWWAEGVPEDEIDGRIRAWMRETGFDTRAWLAENEALKDLTDEQVDIVSKALRGEEWMIAMVRSVAKDGKPIPFYSFMHGDAVVQPATDETPAIIWAFATPATDARAVAEKFVRLCRETYGDQVLKDLKNEDETAVFARMHSMGMSYREIAIQSLRETYPDIIEHPARYRDKIRRERERIAKAIAAFNALWKERIPDSSIG